MELIRDPEEYFFGNSKTCRLCGELCLDAGLHLSSLHHHLGETIVDLLLPAAERGEDLRAVVEAWPQLLHHAHNPHTIGHLTNLDSFELRLVKFRQLLLLLKQHGVGLTALMEPTQERPIEGRGPPFERLECIGDHSWGSNVASRIMLLFPSVDWRRDTRLISSFAMMRDAVETNQNLERIYEAMNFDAILSPTARALSTKSRGDVVECLLGELQVACWGAAVPFNDPCMLYADIGGHKELQKLSLQAILLHALHELYDIVVLYSFTRRIDAVLGIVTELAAKKKERSFATLSTRAPLAELRSNFIPTAARLHHRLPAPMQLHRRREALPCEARHIPSAFKGPDAVAFRRWGAVFVEREVFDAAAEGAGLCLPLLDTAPSFVSGGSGVSMAVRFDVSEEAAQQLPRITGCADENTRSV